MNAVGLLPSAPAIVRRIAAAVKAAVDDGFRPTSIYLVQADRDELAREAPDLWRRQMIGGLPIRASECRAGSKVYCATGASKAVRKRPPP